MNQDGNEAMNAIFGEDEVREVLRDSFYSDSPPAPRKRARRPKGRGKKKKPDHYEVICISLYKEDMARLDAKVKQLKENGHRKMSRSALIRYALDTADLDGLPRSY